MGPTRIAVSLTGVQGSSMCFSAAADLIAGVAVTAIGVDVVRHVDGRRPYAMFAALPLLFGAHQLVEAVVWWSLEGHVSTTAGRIATWAYLLFAFVVLPVYVPLSVWAFAGPGRRRWIGPFIGLGAAVSTVLFAAMLRGPVEWSAADRHVQYGTGLRAGTFVVALYVVATCAPLLLSRVRAVVLFGVVNLVAVAVLAQLLVHGFISLWCAWAAVTSAALALHLRRERSLDSALGG